MARRSSSDGTPKLSEEEEVPNFEPKIDIQTPTIIDNGLMLPDGPRGSRLGEATRNEQVGQSLIFNPLK
eukprot:gene23273-9577_t